MPNVFHGDGYIQTRTVVGANESGDIKGGYAQEDHRQSLREEPDELAAFTASLNSLLDEARRQLSDRDIVASLRVIAASLTGEDSSAAITKPARTFAEAELVPLVTEGRWCFSDYTVANQLSLKAAEIENERDQSRKNAGAGRSVRD